MPAVKSKAKGSKSGGKSVSSHIQPDPRMDTNVAGPSREQPLPPPPKKSTGPKPRAIFNGEKSATQVDQREENGLYSVGTLRKKVEAAERVEKGKRKAGDDGPKEKKKKKKPTLE